MRATLLVAAALVVCSCGSREPATSEQTINDPAYERSMRAAVSELASVFVLGFGFMEIDDDEEAATLASEIAHGYRSAADRFRRIDPPAEVAESHREVIEALEHSTREWEEFAESGGPGTDALDDPTDADRLNGPLSRIQAAGYDVGWK